MNGHLMEKQNALTLTENTLETRVNPADYTPFVGEERVAELERLAAPLSGRTWAHVNSTATGGGVAELLTSVVPLARGLGLHTRWFVLSGNSDFFTVTKKFHNLLQGVDQPLSMDEIFGTYLDTIASNGTSDPIESDVITVHDPQPLGLVSTGSLIGNVLWRCHIDTSTPNPVVWRFLKPYINQCDGAIFTMPEFVGEGVHIPHYEISPCIDPLSVKNHPYSEQEALEVLTPLFEQTDIDPKRPMVAAISRYDVHKNQETVYRAFRTMRDAGRHAPPPYLIYLGNTAHDDPEGEAMLAQLKDVAGDDPDVRFWGNVDDNDRVVGALNRLARVVVHVSTREGFGLVVTEALWQGTPVIGSRVGGIKKQVVDGHTGYLVDPQDVAAIAQRMAELVDDPRAAARLGEGGREHVRKHFLVPELLRRHLLLIRYYTGTDRKTPDFRLNGRSHLDRRNDYRSLHLPKKNKNSKKS